MKWPRPKLVYGYGYPATVYLEECKCTPEERVCPVEERGVCGKCGGAVVGPKELFGNTTRMNYE